MNLCNVDQEKRQTLYQMVKFEEAIARLDKNKAMNRAFLVAFRGTVSKVKKQDIINYVEEAISNFELEDSIVRYVGQLVEDCFAMCFAHTKKIADLLQNEQVGRIPLDTMRQVIQLENEYNHVLLPISYEDYIFLNCLPNERELLDTIKTAYKKLRKDYTSLKSGNEAITIPYETKLNELSKLLNSNRETVKQKDALLAERDKKWEDKEALLAQLSETIKEKDKQLLEKQQTIVRNEIELEQTKEANHFLMKKLNLDHIKTKLSIVAGIDVEGLSATELYRHLSDLEKTELTAKNHRKVKELLASKYAINTLLSEDNTYDQ